MDRFLGFGRHVLFVCRVFFGIEERRIRAQNLEFQKKLMQMRERKAMLEKIPEQLILSEVRKVVEEMQKLNEALTKTEKDVEKYFESVRKDANAVMEAQLEAEEATMHQMIQMQLASQNMLQEKNAMNRENNSGEVIQATQSDTLQENISLKKEDMPSAGPTNSMSQNVHGNFENKEKYT